MSGSENSLFDWPRRYQVNKRIGNDSLDRLSHLLPNQSPGLFHPPFHSIAVPLPTDRSLGRFNKDRLRFPNCPCRAKCIPASPPESTPSGASLLRRIQNPSQLAKPLLQLA